MVANVFGLFRLTKQVSKFENSFFRESRNMLPTRSLGGDTFLNIKQESSLLIWLWERESEHFHRQIWNIFCSFIIEAEPFSIPAAASGTKASPKSKVRIKCYGKYDKCIKSALYKLHRNILTSYFEHLTRSASLLFSFEVKYFLTLKRMMIWKRTIC